MNMRNAIWSHRIAVNKQKFSRQSEFPNTMNPYNAAPFAYFRMAELRYSPFVFICIFECCETRTYQ